MRTWVIAIVINLPFLLLILTTCNERGQLDVVDIPDLATIAELCQTMADDAVEKTKINIEATAERYHEKYLKECRAASKDHTDLVLEVCSSWARWSADRCNDILPVLYSCLTCYPTPIVEPAMIPSMPDAGVLP